jgi:hypothetical protein
LLNSNGFLVTEIVDQGKGISHNKLKRRKNVTFAFQKAGSNQMSNET